jgi:hypothetical protein
MPILDSTDPDDVAPILALLIQEAELPDIPGSAYRRELWAFNAIAEHGKLTLWVSDPSKIRKTQMFELALTFKGTVDPRR